MIRFLTLVAIWGTIGLVVTAAIAQADFDITYVVGAGLGGIIGALQAIYDKVGDIGERMKASSQ